MRDAFLTLPTGSLPKAAVAARSAALRGRPAMVEVGPLSRIDRLFTDAPPPEPFPRLLQDANVRCTVA